MIQQKTAARIGRDKLQYLDEAFRSSRSVSELTAELDFRRVDDLLGAIAKSLGLSAVNLESIEIDEEGALLSPSESVNEFTSLTLSPQSPKSTS